MKPELGKKSISHIGYGAIRLPGVRYLSEKTELTCHLLREFLSLGVNVIDTADYYGAGLANRLITDALPPCPQNLIISLIPSVITWGYTMSHGIDVSVTPKPSCSGALDCGEPQCRLKLLS